jgi:hypothetical protein
VVVGLFLDQAVDCLRCDGEGSWGRHFADCGKQFAGIRRN